MKFVYLMHTTFVNNYSKFVNERLDCLCIFYQIILMQSKPDWYQYVSESDWDVAVMFCLHLAKYWKKKFLFLSNVFANRMLSLYASTLLPLQASYDKVASWYY